MREAFYLSFRYLRGRSPFLSPPAFFSLLALWISSSFLVVVLSVFYGFQRQIWQSIFSTEPHIQIDRRDKEPIRYWKEMKKNLLERFPSFSITGRIEAPAILKYYQIIEPVFLVGEEFPKEEQGFLYPPYAPKLVEKEDAPFKKGSVFIGKEMAYLYGIALGDPITLVVARGTLQLKRGVRPSSKSFRVKGFFQTGNYEYDSKLIFLPLEEAQNLLGISQGVSHIAIRLPLEEIPRMGYIKEEISSFLPFLFRVETLEERQKNFFSALRLERTIMTIIVFLFVLASVIGVVIATLYIIRSHWKDIGILRTLGVKKRTLLWMFLLYGLWIGILGTAGGISSGVYLAYHLEKILLFLEEIINYLGSLYKEYQGGVWYPFHFIPKDVYYFDHIPIFFDKEALYVVSILSILLSGLASFFPAYFSSKKEPVEIIREGEV